MQNTLVLLAKFVLFLATLVILSATGIQAQELATNQLGIYQVDSNLNSLLMPVNQTERWNLVYQRDQAQLPEISGILYHPKFDVYVTANQVPAPDKIAGQSAQVELVKAANTTENNRLKLAIVIDKSDKSEPKPDKAKPTVVAKPKPVVVALPVSDLDGLFDRYAQEYGLSASVLKRIAQCESGLRPEALSSNGLYGGLFQFVAGTWVSNRKAMGEDPNPELRFNAEAAIKTAAFKISRDGYNAWPVCGQRAIAAVI